MLLRLQRRIAEGNLAANDVKVYFCDAPRGVSTLVPLDVDLLGLARRGDAPVVDATDSDWLEHKAILVERGGREEACFRITPPAE